MGTGKHPPFRQRPEPSHSNGGLGWRRLRRVPNNSLWGHQGPITQSAAVLTDHPVQYRQGAFQQLLQLCNVSTLQEARQMGHGLSE